MQTYPLPTNESERLKLLHSLCILDTPPDERFDCIARLTKRVFDIPIAMVTLIDSDRQWFKSVEDILTAREIPREISFCNYTIANEQSLIVNDLTQDERFADNPHVVDDGFRFYAGVPLMYRDRYALGTLCMLDTSPRQMSEDDVALLEELGTLVECEIAALETATIDVLTNLFNRRGFETLTNHVLKLSARNDLPNCLIHFELDQLRSINAQFGHAQGDQILVEFAELLHRSFRDVDILARIGGNEFAAFLSDSDHEQSEDAVNRLTQSVAEFNRATENRYPMAFRASITEYDPTRHMFISDLLVEGLKNMGSLEALNSDSQPT